jgi:hypothetical protein
MACWPSAFFFAPLFEKNTTYRTIHTDGRPPESDPEPSWRGYSVGKWDGDTLVVETNGLKEDTWLDYAGSPITPRGKLIERFRRKSYGNLDVEITVDDPQAYKKPWTTIVNWQIAGARPFLGSESACECRCACGCVCQIQRGERKHRSISPERPQARGCVAPEIDVRAKAFSSSLLPYHLRE